MRSEVRLRSPDQYRLTVVQVDIAYVFDAVNNEISNETIALSACEQTSAPL